MKIGFRTAGFREWPLPQALQELARLGYDGVELCLEHPDARPERLSEGEAEALAQTVRDLGLEIASVSYHGDTDEPQQRLANQLRSIGLTAAMGRDLLILNTPRQVAGVEQEQWHELVAWLEESLLPEAERCAVRLAFEPEPGLVLHGLREMLQLLSHLPHPRLGVNLDLGHAWLTDESVPDTVRQLAPWLWHVHFEDFPRGEHRHLPPGEGDMPLREIHAALQQAGYDGTYTIDLFNITDDPVKHAATSLAATRSLLS
jgi:sugar phosphate isomerase/epimerase